MTVPDYPPGEWSVLLVGAQWVSITSVAALNTAIANRGTIQTNFSQLHDTLQQAITTTLAGQEGETADAIRDAFRQGADQAAQIAEKNGTYKKALQGALDHVTQLREKLTQIANDGNQKINDELKSNDKPDIKVAKIAQLSPSVKDKPTKLPQSVLSASSVRAKKSWTRKVPASRFSGWLATQASTRTSSPTCRPSRIKSEAS